MDTDLKPLSGIEEVNQQWIVKMLSVKLGTPITVHSWNSRLPKNREGFLSDIAYLKVVYSGGDDQQTDLRLVLKVLPKDPKIRKIMADGGIDKREVTFYKFAISKEFQDICKKANFVMPIPEVYYAGYSDNDATVVMSDLNSKNYKSGLVKEGNTLEQTKVALNAAAQIHAVGLAYIKKYGEEDTLAPLALEFNVGCYEPVFVPNLKIMADEYEGTPLAKSMRSLMPFPKEILYLRKRYPLLKTLIHGDFWTGQLMYSNDESNVSVFDWQCCHVDNASSDVLSMLFMSSDPKVLEDHMDEVLESYWEALDKAAKVFGVTLDVTFEQFKKNMEDLWLYGFMMIFISIHEFIPAGNLTHERLRGYAEFLEKRGVIEKFVKMVQTK